MNQPATPISKLSQFSLLEIKGPDAIKFLQGQVTCDLNALDSNHFQHGAHCTAKGRMVANFDAIQRDEHTLWLRLPSNNLQALQLSLAKYAVFSKVQINDLSDHYACIGLIQESDQQILEPLGVNFLDGPVTEYKEHLLIQQNQHHIEVWSPKDSSPLTGFQPSQLGTDELWAAADIRNGRGWISQATTDTALPQDLNLQTEAINGINFKKGCYTGQEIVARMHYKGKLKRHLYHFKTNSAQDIQAGAELFCADKTQSVGTVINAVAIDQHCELLAITTEANAASGELHTSNATTDKLELIALPYAITNEV